MVSPYPKGVLRLPPAPLPPAGPADAARQLEAVEADPALRAWLLAVELMEDEDDEVGSGFF